MGIYINKPLQKVLANKLMPMILKIIEINYETGMATAMVSYYEYDQWQKYKNAVTEADSNIMSLPDTGLPSVITVSLENIKDMVAIETAVYDKVINILSEMGYEVSTKDIITFE